ncbi:hypothetical protein [Sphingosinithalassobacter sp. CS137]|uniref:hypothetical protein n=1 Tax=Sphingosinithalassobacter sp. CS137 TaxID=2762748 RepID=UPI0021D3A01A|nr:hypothetical protein [Sphingosinithalassobacter sp. CS137]
MIAVALLLIAGDPETALDAERAFSTAAQVEGQWAAFRRFADTDGVIFMPAPANPHRALPAEEPPIAVQWWPARSFVSCDGSVAVNTGSWARPHASGYFSTVWERQPDGSWKWALDHGDIVDGGRALPERVEVRTADCSAVPPVAVIPSLGARQGNGASRDGTLRWGWTVFDDGSRRFFTNLWNGSAFERVIYDEVGSGA